MTIQFDTKDLMKTLQNTVGYGYGYIAGIESERLNFNRRLGNLIVAMLGKYIDTIARLSPERLHHVYEWGETGVESARLFQFNMVPTISTITITGSFLASGSVSASGGQPFTNKAEIMENGIEIIIEPKESSVLAFEADGETVFVNTQVTIEHPGGPEVEGAFGETVDEFLNGYVQSEVIRKIVKDMETANEFTDSFAQGTRVGASAGKKAGKKYMSLPEVIDEFI